MTCSEIADCVAAHFWHRRCPWRAVKEPCSARVACARCDHAGISRPTRSPWKCECADEMERATSRTGLALQWTCNADGRCGPPTCGCLHPPFNSGWLDRSSCCVTANAYRRVDPVCNCLAAWHDGCSASECRRLPKATRAAVVADVLLAVGNVPSVSGVEFRQRLVASPRPLVRGRRSAPNRGRSRAEVAGWQ